MIMETFLFVSVGVNLGLLLVLKVVNDLAYDRGVNDQALETSSARGLEDFWERQAKQADSKLRTAEKMADEVSAAADKLSLYLTTGDEDDS